MQTVEDVISESFFIKTKDNSFNTDYELRLSQQEQNINEPRLKGQVLHEHPN